jgi:ABC-2 type transport system permease protein
MDALVTLGAGALIFGLKFAGNPLAALLVVALTTLSFAAVGILSAAFTVVFKRGDPFRVLVGGASFLIGGVIYPVEILPDWIGAVAELLPITHGARALRGLLLDGRDLSGFGSELAVLAAFALVGIPLAIFAFARAVRWAKREGSLLQY